MIGVKIAKENSYVNYDEFDCTTVEFEDEEIENEVNEIIEYEY